MRFGDVPATVWRVERVVAGRDIFLLCGKYSREFLSVVCGVSAVLDSGRECLKTMW